MVKVYAKVISLFVFIFLLFGHEVSAQCSTIDFSATDTAGCSPLVVHFIAVGGSPSSKYEWDFDNGAGFLTATDTPTQIFSVAKASKYKITLRITTGSTVCTVTKSLIHVLQTPKPGFKTYPGNVICNPKAPVILTDTTAGEVSRTWIIDGVKDTHRVVVYYPSGLGTKGLSLQATNRYGCSGYFIDPSYFSVYDTIPTDFCGDLVINSDITGSFTPMIGKTTRTVVNYFWQFPGGSPSSYTGKIPPTITWSDKTKSYDVSLTITTKEGCSYTILRKGYVSYVMKGQPDVVCVNQYLNFVYNPSFSAQKTYDGSYLALPSSFFDPTTNKYSYKQAGLYDGTYYYRLVQGGCFHSATVKNMFKVKGPSADFTAIPNQNCNPKDTVFFKNNSDTFQATNVTYTWRIYDTAGHTIKILGPTKTRDTFFIFGVNGKFSITLKTKSSNGCSDTMYKKDYVVINHAKADFSTDNQTVCVGKQMTITGDSHPPDDPKHPSYVYDWLITNSDSPTLYYNLSSKSLNFTPTVPGYYDVRLIVSNGTNNKCADTLIRKRWLKVIGVSTDIVASVRSGCPNPSMVTTLTTTKKYVAYPRGTSAASTFLWTANPIDGVVIVDPTAQTTDMYVTDRNCYDIKLTITTVVGKDTCRNVFSKLRYVCAGVDNSFELPKNKCLGDTLPIANYSDPTVQKYKWLVSPKGAAKFWPSDTIGSPSIIYQKDTCIRVSLIDTKIIDGGPCSDTSTADFCPVLPHPDFTAPSKTVYCAPTTVEFYNQSKNAKSYSWDFGDGSIPLVTKSDTVQHVYTSITKPDFDITLTAFDSNGCGKSITKSAFLTVNGPVPRFFLSAKKACDKVTVQFTNKSKNVNKFYFFYGDNTVIKGNNFDSFKLAPHSYAYDTLNLSKDSTNFYPIALSLDDSNCRVFYKDTITLYRSPRPQFKAAKNIGCAPFQAVFINESRFSKKWRWDFDGDGKIDDSTQNPVFTYKKAGKYTVKLIAINGICSDSVVFKNLIEVLPVPTARYIPSQHTICGSAHVSFTNVSTDYVRYVFDYGDGTQADSNVMVPHLYYYDSTRFTEDSVLYIPTLTAYNALGCPTVFKDTLRVYPSPIAGFDQDAVSGCAPLLVHFTQKSRFAYKYEWDFDNDGIIDAAGPSASHIFKPGFYTVKMLARNYGGCVDSMVKVNLISVNPVPVADFQVSDSDVCVKDIVNFTDYTFPKANIRKWIWKFDEPKADNDTLNLENPQFRFLTPGYHNISLTVEDFKGCRDTIVKRAVYVEDTVPPPAGAIDYVTVDDSSHVRVVWSSNAIRHFREYHLSRYDKLGTTLVDSAFSTQDTVFTDNGASLNANIQSYAYSLQTINGCGYVSAYSPQHATIQFKAQPDGFSKASMYWSAYQGWPPLRYIILRSNDNFATFSRIDSVKGDMQSYVDSNLCDETYCYAVLAVDSTGRFYSRSNISCAHPPYQYQSSPLRLRYATVKDNRDVMVTWEPGFQLNAHKFVLDKKVNTDDWEQNYTTTTHDTFVDQQVNIFANKYTYRVRSLDDCGYLSPASNTGTSILLGQKIADDKIILRWNSYRNWGNKVNKYLVQVQQRNKKFRTVATVPGTDTSYADDSVYRDIDTAYCYRIIAIERSPKPDSSVSNIVCAVLPSRVYVPNAFSPNADGLNDIWKPSAVSIYNAVGNAILNFNAKIYDRWGTILWESNDVNAGWDGTYQGRKVQVDTYIYLINADGIDGRSIHLKGNVTVIR